MKILVDSGSQISAVSTRWYEENMDLFQGCPTLPVSGIAIRSALGTKTRGVKRQIMSQMKLAEYKSDIILLVVDNLTANVIVGSDWLLEHKAIIDYNQKALVIPGSKALPFEETAPVQEVPAMRIEIIKDESVGEEALTQLHNTNFQKSLGEIMRTSDLLDEDEKGELRAFMERYQEVFRDEIGRVKDFEYELRIKEHKPYKADLYPVAFELIDAVREQVREWEKQGIIREQNTAYVNPLVAVKKPNGKVRVCLDARILNEILLPDYESVPRTEDLLIKIGRAKYISTLDLTSAFLQIPLKEKSQEYTGFIFDNTTYVFNRVPFGTKESMGALARCLHFVLGPELGKKICIFADDILVGSETFEEHICTLREIFDKFRQQGVTVSIEKSHFCRNEIKYLGHIIKINNEGVTMEPEVKKLEALKEFPRPYNQKTLKGFLGLAAFYSKYNPKFSEITQPLNKLLRKETRWKWDQTCEKAFQETKDLFDSLYLHLPDLTKDLVLQTDASGYAISGWLYQTDGSTLQIINCVSRTLKGAEITYTITEKELLAIIYALEKFKRFLLYRRFTIRTDNKALTFIKKITYGNNRITRWIMKLQDYDFAIEHCKGKDNIVADVLSRTVKEQEGIGEQLQEILIHSIQTERGDQAKGINELHVITENEVKDLIKEIKKDQRRTAEEEPDGDDYRIKKGIKFIKQQGRWKVWVPQGKLDQLIKLIHKEWGHYGLYKVHGLMKNYFCARKLRSRIKTVINTCEICQLVKGNTQTTELRSLTTRRPNEILAVDLYGPLIRNDTQLRYVLVTVDLFSKYVRLYTMERPTARNCERILKERQFQDVGKPNKILTDQGSQFKSKAWARFLKRNKIEHIRTPIMHPIANGCVERTNREITKLLRIYCQADHKAWPDWIGHIERVINTTPSKSTEYTPIEIQFHDGDFELFPPQILSFPKQEPKETYNQKIIQARLNLNIAASRNKKYYDSRRANVRYIFSPGDRVLVKRNPFERQIKGEMPKLRLRFQGPYFIKEEVTLNMYKLIDDKNRERGIFHANEMKPFFE